MNGSTATLSVNENENIGAGGVGLFTQTAGTNTVGVNGSGSVLTIGATGNGYGTYILNGASAALRVNGTEDIGYNAAGNLGNGSSVAYAGTFNQSAGYHVIVGSLNIANNFNDTGQFILSGGNLSSGSVLQTTGFSQPTAATSYVGNGGIGVFNQTGGTYTFGASIAAYGAGGC